VIRSLVVLALIGLLWGQTAVPPSHAQEEPTVQAVMFWMEGCGHCVWVKTNVLPPLEAKYGDRWQLELIEIRGAEDFDRLLALATAIGVPRQHIGVPLLLIGDDVLVGSMQIPTELPGLIEQHLAAGGVAFPTYPGLAEWLPLDEACPPAAPCPGVAQLLPPVYSVAEAQEADALTRSLTEGVEPAAVAATETAVAHDGFTLAVIILVGMVLALAYTAVRLSRAKQARDTDQPPAWPQAALPLLGVIGLGVAAYLAYVETQSVAAICGPIGDCNVVQTSEYAYLFGIPIGVLGVLGYLAILAAWSWSRWWGDKRAALALLAMTAFGVIFSIYLTYLEPFVIGAVCAWCLTSSVVMTLLMLLSAGVVAPYLQAAPAHQSQRR
jgi:uncharacterized membrane protein